MPDERTVILWDVMGTLVYDPFYEDIPRFFGMTLDEVFRWKHPTAWVRFELGELTETEFAQSFFHDCRSVDAVGLRRCVQDAYQWLDGMPLLLQRLREQPHRAQSIRQCAFSNYPMWYEWIEEKLLLS
ncbi:MAG: hypothetical protein KDA99_08615, partial [Planctomycetales bacterium]|nr:hypothetical protein [Planctomycetales bacterium]